MKKITAITLALFCAGLLVKPVQAADIGTEFGVADDLGVYGIQGSATDPDVEIKGFSVFGATQSAPALNIPAAPGNIFVNGYVQVSSGMYVAAYSTFSAGIYAGAESTFAARVNLPAPGSIYLPNGTAGQVLRKNAGGYLEWSNSPTGTGTQYKLPIWSNAAGTELGDSLLVQDAAGTYMYIGGATLFKVTAANGNTLIGGTLDLTGNFAVNTNKFNVAALTGNTTVAGTLGVTGAATLSSTLGVTGDVAVNTNKFNVTALTGNTAIAGTLGVTGAATLSSTLGVTGDVAVNTNKFNVTAVSGNTSVAGTLGVTGATTLTDVTINGVVTSGAYVGKFYSGANLAAWIKNK